MRNFMKWGSGALVPLITLFFGFQRPAEAQVRPIEDGPIHEAFVPAATGVVALEAIAKEPPPAITERIPAKCDPEAIWIGGYWSYNEETDDFDWVGGCWRKPPPGRTWIAGLWKQFDEGWVWIRGFWSSVAPSEIDYIDDAPPDPVDEDPPVAPGGAYFWLAGYWGWAPSTGFIRYAGHWEPMDPNWVLVPASYTWRPEGYVFIPAFWDWPIDKRGCTYQSVYIEPAARAVEYVYEPTVIVEPAYVVNWCYAYYPDYVYFVHHHYHYHPVWWQEHYDVPTWWGWHGWWAFSWHDHWGLWWWYTNPGYPHPHFMTASLAASIYPPSQATILKVKKTVVHKYKIITDKGVISPKESRELARKAKGFEGDGGKKGKFAPVIAAETKSKDKDKAATDEKDKKGKDLDDSKLAAKPLFPGGTKEAKKDEEGDDKKHPPKPKAGKPELVVGPATGAKSIFTGAGEGKGKDRDKDKDKDKLKGKVGMPPITTKGKETDDGKSKEPPIGPIGGDKGKDKDKGKGKDGKPTGPPIVPIGGDKGKDKDDKPKGPPIGPIGGDKGKDKDKDKDKGGDKSKGPIGPTGGDKDKPKVSGSTKKVGGGSSGDFKIKETEKPPKLDSKPTPDSKPPKPPAPTSDTKGGKDKDKDSGKKDKDKG